MTRVSRSLIATALAAAVLLLSGCKEKAGMPAEEDSAQADSVRVSVMTAHPERVVVFDELPGRVSAFRTAEIRPQVGGIVKRRLFVEGAEVEAEQPLFEIDAAPFIADVAAAAAVLARAEAEMTNVQLKFDRAKALFSVKAVSEASLGDATALLAQSKASIAEAKATLARRKLELSYATVKSPISGRIGQAMISEGGLVASPATSPLAVIQQIDRVYVDVRQPSANRGELPAGKAGESVADMPVELFTANGKPYALPGRVLFSDISVDVGTGNLGIRIEVPNPRRQLLPGMYIRAKVPTAVHAAALMVPQEAIQRDPAGRPQLVIVGPDKTGSRRTVQLGAEVNGRYMVTAGLAAGETFVVLGQDRVQDGVTLETVPYRSDNSAAKT